MRFKQTICGFLVNGALRHVGESTHAQLARRKRKALVHLHIPTIVNKHRYALHTKHNWWFRMHADNISWYVAWGFVLGSVLFSLGAYFCLMPGMISVWLNNWLFFIGSLFFTFASYLQYLESINRVVDKQRSWRYWGIEPSSCGFWASLTQLLGAVLFNINTWAGMYDYSSVLLDNLYIRLPDFLGSVCFLVSAVFSWLEIRHQHVRTSILSVSWWVVYVNLLGCVLFQVSALFAFYLPHELLGFSAAFISTANINLLGGSICFLMVGYLLLVELNENEYQLKQTH